MQIKHRKKNVMRTKIASIILTLTMILIMATGCPAPTHKTAHDTSNPKSAVSEAESIQVDDALRTPMVTTKPPEYHVTEIPKVWASPEPIA